MGYSLTFSAQSALQQTHIHHWLLNYVSVHTQNIPALSDPTLDCEYAPCYISFPVGYNYCAWISRNDHRRIWGICRCIGRQFNLPLYYDDTLINTDPEPWESSNYRPISLVQRLAYSRRETRKTRAIILQIERLAAQSRKRNGSK